MSKTNYIRLRDAYIILALQLLITLFVVKYLRDNPVFNVKVQSYIWIPIILTFILLFILSLSHYSTTVKLFFFTVFSICLGTICMATSKYFSNESVMIALKATFAVFVTLSLVGWICYTHNIDLSKLQFILLVSLIGLIIATLFAYKYPQHIKKIFVFGFVIFAILIAVDTYSILKGRYTDSVNDALSLYLNFFNLFQQILGFNTSE
jgi:FtsH-binding integral membrane protein